jgi:hypothetical protein
MAALAAVTVDLLPARESERIDARGAVSSAQEAILAASPEWIDSLWQPAGVERLARGYWRHLHRVSRGLLRVVYEERSRTVVLGFRWLPLLRFRAPEYEISPSTATVTWRIDRGLLVAAEGRGSGWLRIALDRLDAEERSSRVHVRVEVRNFYPWLRGRGPFARLGARLYSATQVRAHRWITFGFLRSLENLR